VLEPQRLLRRESRDHLILMTRPAPAARPSAQARASLNRPAETR
jgi:hypothetical protein